MRVCAWSGLDSLVRNFAYFFMIVRLLNLIGTNTIGGYYLAMHILWSFLLVPILALSESAKVLIANHSADLLKVRKLWYSSLAIGVIIVLLWLAFLPFWRDAAGFLNSNIEVVDLSVKAMAILIIPYILLALNLVTDSIFYGVGKTRYMAYQAIITNGTVYVTHLFATMSSPPSLPRQKMEFGLLKLKTLYGTVTTSMPDSSKMPPNSTSENWKTTALISSRRPTVRSLRLKTEPPRCALCSTYTIRGKTEWPSTKGCLSRFITPHLQFVSSFGIILPLNHSAKQHFDIPRQS